MSQEILTVKEVAKYLRLNENTVYQLIRDKELPSFKVGGRAIRVRKRDLETYIESQQTTEKEESTYPEQDERLIS